MKTVFVMGAGASKEAGLPLGVELKGQLADFLEVDSNDFGDLARINPMLLRVLRDIYGQDVHMLKEAFEHCNQIAENMPLAISIDNFIDAHRSNLLLAKISKIAIVNCILDAERESKMYFEPFGDSNPLDFSRLEGTWYLSFFQRITENCSFDELEERLKLVSLVIFNYDRCVEHFLYYAFMSYYKMSSADAAKFISTMTIVHPYGTVGSLEWQEHAVGRRVPFGTSVTPQILQSASENIKTFCESDVDAGSELRAVMSHAQRLVFLGFAFHHMNMNLLSGGKGHQYARSGVAVKSFGTTYEMSSHDQTAVSGALNHIYEGRVQSVFKNLTCAELFEYYSRSITFV
ncbi:MAG: hypothetical protein CMF22_12895 [Idiomarinaceae bacterium]|nr:hypothetical protein [Idiomarinaceae bacterium]